MFLSVLAEAEAATKIRGKYLNALEEEQFDKLVDAANGLLSQAADLSRFDAESRTAGPLQGDATLRRLVTDLRLERRRGNVAARKE